MVTAIVLSFFPTFGGSPAWVKRREGYLGTLWARARDAATFRAIVVAWVAASTTDGARE